ncbi:MAG: type II toxin-antitoxin system RelE/ParE family toxin [Candidatus Weimeria sp.]
MFGAFQRFLLISRHYLLFAVSPGNNRVFYFYFGGNTFVLLHQFRKKSQKTPQREIKQALAERDDWKARHEKR